MTLAREIRRTLRLALPMMGAQLLHIFMIFVDNLMVGRLGRDPLAGLALAGAFYGFVYIIVTGLMGSLVPLVSQANGAGKPLLAGHYTRQGLLVAAVSSFAIGAGLWWSEPILLAMGQTPTASALAADYLQIMVLTVPAQLAFVAFRNFVEGAGNSVPSVVIAATVALLNIPLDYVLIFGKFGAPELGVAGAAWATAALTCLSVVLLLAYIASKEQYRSFELFRLPRPDLATLREIIWIGVPLAGTVATEMGFFMCSTFLMGHLGATELAAHQVALNATAFVFMLPLGLSFAVSIRVGAHLGRGDRAAARTAWLASLIITSGIVLLTMSLFLAAPGFIVGLYDQQGEVRDLAVKLLIVGGFFQAFDGFQCVGLGALRGAADTRFAFVATLIAFWVFGIAVVAWQYRVGSPEGIWYGLLVGLGVAMVAHHGRALFVFARS